MKGGEIFRPVVTVKNGGSAVLGLLAADFAVTGYLNATAPVIAFTVTELGSGRYRISITTPATILPAWFVALISSVAGYTVYGGHWEGMLRAHTIDEVHALSVRPIVSGPATDLSLRQRNITLIANRYAPLSFTILDQDSEPIDHSAPAFNNWRFNVWTKTHSGLIYTLSAGITGDAQGVVSWTVPEDAAFHAQMAAAIAAGEDVLTLYWDLVADAGSVTAQSQTVLFGQLLLQRFEGAA